MQFRTLSLGPVSAAADQSTAKELNCSRLGSGYWRLDPTIVPALLTSLRDRTIAGHAADPETKTPPRATISGGHTVCLPANPSQLRIAGSCAVSPA